MPDLPEPQTERNNDSAATSEEIGELLQRAEQAERQRDEYFTLLRQAQADYENAHQRNRRDRELEQQYRSEKLALDLLPVLDNLERALMSAREAGEKSPLVDGVALVHSQLLDTLKRHGITPIDALNKPFDPSVHQAVLKQPAAEH